MEVQQFHYDNKIVQKFLYATILWGVVGMLVGLLLAFMFLFPNLTDGISWLSFGRLRPLHTNAVIFAFVGNAIFAGVYYSLQRLLKARMFSDLLSNINFWGWQLIIVAAAITLPLGYTTSKEYAELEWMQNDQFLANIRAESAGNGARKLSEPLKKGWSGEPAGESIC